MNQIAEIRIREFQRTVLSRYMPLYSLKTQHDFVQLLETQLVLEMCGWGGGGGVMAVMLYLCTAMTGCHLSQYIDLLCPGHGTVK